MSMRNILMVASLAISVLTYFVLARGGAKTEGAHQITIGVSFDTLTEERWQKDRDLMEKRFSESVKREVIDNLVPKYFQEAVKEKNLVPLYPDTSSWDRIPAGRSRIQAPEWPQRGD